MTNEIPVLDWIKLSNGQTLSGIVDYSNDRFVHFYDFNGITDPNVIVVAIIWRQQEQDLRFSVYCSMYFPKLKIPKVKLLNRIAINDSSIDLDSVYYNPEKQRFSIKK